MATVSSGVLGGEQRGWMQRAALCGTETAIVLAPLAARDSVAPCRT